MAGWFYGHTVATKSQQMRGHAVRTERARNPTDYIYENLIISRVVRRVLGHKHYVCVYHCVKVCVFVCEREEGVCNNTGLLAGSCPQWVLCHTT